MRKWLAILLLVFMPLQLSWAAAASYCQHETGTSAKHFGHHDHQHKIADGKDASSDPAKTIGGDPDCASCHAGCLSALPGAVTIASLADSSLDTADYWLVSRRPLLNALNALSGVSSPDRRGARSFPFVITNARIRLARDRIKPTSARLT